MVGLALEASLRALTDRRGHDVARVLWEERDVVADTDQESGGAQMVAVLDQTLGELVRVKKHELVEELEWDAVA